MPTVYSPPVSTYVALATTTASGGETSVTFSSIPASYRDLIMVWGGSASGTVSVFVRFNSDTGSNYSYVYANGDGSSATSASGSTTYISQNFLTASQNTMIMQIMDYSATDKHKTVLTRWGVADTSLQMAAERWASTSAINEISCAVQSGTITAGSTFSLYGIAS